jgi:hypothetical protein
MTSAPSVPHEVLINSRLKVKWANYHLRHLVETLRVHLESEFYRLFIQEYLEEGASGIHLEVINPLPHNVSFLIGDIVHNLRAALDHLTYGIVKAIGGSASMNLYFPIDESRRQLVNTDRKREIETKVPKLLDIIFDEIKPFNTPDGDGFLWSLNQLDRIDKHRMIIPTLQITTVPGVYAVSDQGSRMDDCSLTVSDTGLVKGFKLGGKWKIERHGKPRFDIFLAEGDVFVGEPVIPTLAQLGQATTSTIKILQSHFFREES